MRTREENTQLVRQINEGEGQERREREKREKSTRR